MKRYLIYIFTALLLFFMFLRIECNKENNIKMLTIRGKEASRMVDVIWYRITDNIVEFNDEKKNFKDYIEFLIETNRKFRVGLEYKIFREGGFYAIRDNYELWKFTNTSDIVVYVPYAFKTNYIPFMLPKGYTNKMGFIAITASRQLVCLDKKPEWTPVDLEAILKQNFEKKVNPQENSKE